MLTTAVSALVFTSCAIEAFSSRHWSLTRVICASSAWALCNSCWVRLDPQYWPAGSRAVWQFFLRRFLCPGDRQNENGGPVKTTKRRYFCIESRANECSGAENLKDNRESTAASTPALNPQPRQ